MKQNHRFSAAILQLSSGGASWMTGFLDFHGPSLPFIPVAKRFHRRDSPAPRTDDPFTRRLIWFCPRNGCVTHDANGFELPLNRFMIRRGHPTGLSLTFPRPILRVSHGSLWMVHEHRASVHLLRPVMRRDL